MAQAVLDTDPFDLNRFVAAQESVYARALGEIKRGEKRSHWMWYIFPQIDGLGYSTTSKQYALKSIEEAHAYLAHPLLGTRLRECAEAVDTIEGRTASQIFGSPDDMKLRSCATLFAAVANPVPENSVFERILAKYFHGEGDMKTLHLLEKLGGSKA